MKNYEKLWLLGIVVFGIGVIVNTAVIAAMGLLTSTIVSFGPFFENYKKEVPERL